MMMKRLLCMVALAGFCCTIFASVSCPVPKTGQTTSYRTGDDGDLESGAAYPYLRFFDNGDGTVADKLTGLEWIKAPHSLPGNSETMSYGVEGIDFCTTLTFAGHDDWRLPSRKEMMSLVDYGHSSPALPGGHPFTGVHNSYYWLSTYCAQNRAILKMSMGSGISSVGYGGSYVWPVRSR